MCALDFLYKLANDPTQTLQFRRDPLGFARAAGLSEELAKLIAGRDSAQLRRFLSEGTEAAAIYTSESAAIYTSETAVVYSCEVA